MSHEAHNPLDHPEVRTASVSRYLGAFIIGLGLMLVALWLVAGHAMQAASLITALSLLALVAVLAQLYLLFRLDLSESRLWHTISLAMTVPLFIMAVGLTIWMFHSLTTRTMLPGAGM